MKKIFQFLKPILLTIILIGLLQVTGLWGSASAGAQMLVLKTGVLNADVETPKSPEDFNYDFSIKDLNGNAISFENYKGKVIFINLWATWCGPCRAEMPGIQSLADKLKDNKQIEFVMISVDKEVALPKVSAYLKKNEFTFPVFMPHGYFPEQLQVPSIPTTFIVGTDGKILMKEVGSRNYDTKKMVNFLIEQTTK